MCDQSELRVILQKIAKTYREVYGTSIVKIVLYGSYARGDYDSESDVDIVAIVQGNRETLQEKLKEVWNESCELELEFGTIVSPTVIPYQEFMQYRNDLPYYRNIEEEGVEIVA